MPTWIKTGFWEKKSKGFKDWLNLDNLISESSTLQNNYNNSANGNIVLSANKPISIYDTNGTTLLFKVDPITDSTVSPLKIDTYSTTLLFDHDKDIYMDVTGTSPVFTLAGSGNINGVGIILRLNKPTGITFPGSFEADPSSAILDSTKLNVYFILYFSNWNGSGTSHVIYKNSLFTAL